MMSLFTMSVSASYAFEKSFQEPVAKVAQNFPEKFETASKNFINFKKYVKYEIHFCLHFTETGGNHLACSFIKHH